MSYLALYRKFRPETFADVRGQDPIVTTLKNQVKTGRVGHAYLFCGTRGTGKTSVAKILARAVNCQEPRDGSPCGECAVCRAIKNGTSMNVIEIDAASNNGVDNIREIVEEVRYRPAEGNYKVYIIDEVHMLSAGAFNALLKTLEEPPGYVMFILATTEAHKIPVTILSRCQRYDFRRMTVDTIAGRIHELLQAEGVSAEEKAVRYIAKAADGSMRDALSLLDQCIAFYLGQTLSYDKVLDVLGAVDTDVFSRLLRAVLAGNVTQAIGILDGLIAGGRELSQFADDFIWYLRNLLLVKTAENPEDAVDVSAESLALLKEEAEKADTDTLMRYIRVFSDLQTQLRFAVQKRVLTEVALIRLCRPAMETGMDSVLDRLRILEEKAEKQPVVYVTEGSARPEGRSATPGPDGNASAPLPKAAPEELQKIAAEWKYYVGQTDGLFHEVLRTSHPRYNGETGENILYVCLNGIPAKNCVSNPAYGEQLKAIIERRLGKSLDMRLVMEDDRSAQGLSDISVDDMIRSAVHMDVVEEEEPVFARPEAAENSSPGSAETESEKQEPPDIEDDYPDREENYPDIEDNYPDIEDDYPDIEEPDDRDEEQT